MLASWQLELALQTAMAATPVALYFLILGLLNSQRRPQLLSARLDFILLLAAVSPLLVTPLLRWIGATALTVTISIAAVAGLIAWAAPAKGKGWVIYNIPLNIALRAISDALNAADIPFTRQGHRFDLADGGRIRISPFPLLRNVSITAETPDGAGLERFEGELAHHLGRLEVIPSATAAAFVLISTAVIVAPMALMANRMPEMVRLLTDLIR